MAEVKLIVNCFPFIAVVKIAKVRIWIAAKMGYRKVDANIVGFRFFKLFGKHYAIGWIKLIFKK